MAGSGGHSIAIDEFISVAYVGEIAKKASPGLPLERTHRPYYCSTERYVLCQQQLPPRVLHISMLLNLFSRRPLLQLLAKLTARQHTRRRLSMRLPRQDFWAW